MAATQAQGLDLRKIDCSGCWSVFDAYLMVERKELSGDMAGNGKAPLD